MTTKCSDVKIFHTWQMAVETWELLLVYYCNRPSGPHGNDTLDRVSSEHHNGRKLAALGRDMH